MLYAYFTILGLIWYFFFVMKIQHILFEKVTIKNANYK